MQFHFEVCTAAVEANASCIYSVLKALVDTVENKYREKLYCSGFPVCEPRNRNDILGLKTIIDNYALIGFYKQWDDDENTKNVLIACYLIASYAVECTMPYQVQEIFASIRLAKGVCEQVNGILSACPQLPPSLEELKNLVEKILNIKTAWKILAPPKAAGPLYNPR